MKKFEEYYIGLDMGTGSVGWAVTDPTYNIIKRHGKALWGICLFESAKTAEEMYGAQALPIRYKEHQGFENDVEMYGAQALIKLMKS